MKSIRIFNYQIIDNEMKIVIDNETKPKKRMQWNRNPEINCEYSIVRLMFELLTGRIVISLLEPM